MSEPKDEFVEAEVERALRPYRGMLSEGEMAGLEMMVRDLLENDPVAVDLLHAARPRTPPLETGAEAPSDAPSKKPADQG